VSLDRRDDLHGVLGAEGEARLAAIERHVGDAAFVAAAREAHNLAGAIRVLGLEEAGVLAAELERALAEAAVGAPLDPTPFGDLLTRLRTALPPPGRPPGPPEAGVRAATIVYIEDSATNALLVERLLARRGFATLVATTGAEGLALAREVRPALVLCDLRLPDLEGIEVVRELARDPATATIPIVVVSGALGGGEADALRAAGASMLLAKPFDVDGLFAAVDEALTR
jgi:CheY-like chemotaxis protein/HPt (histidine-containing phosphotransfer) domain-containing protein